MSKRIEYDEIIDTNGVKVPFVARIITPKIERPMRNSRYEGGECATLREILVAGDRVLEFGSGVGLISTVAAQMPGVESVTTVEANPELIPLILETHRLNDVPNINVLNGIVVSSNQKRSAFFLRPDFWASSTEPDSRPYDKKKHLPCFNVQKLIEQTNPTVIVCDIEGGELGLFDQADLSAVRAVILEMHPKVYGEASVEEITRVLEAKGLAYSVPAKPSTVRRFERFQNVSVLANTPDTFREHLAAPPMNGLESGPWNPKSARFFVSTCMKDEGPFILEWLAWHKSIGIQDFVVFTNDCTDGTDLLLDRLQELGELRHLPNPALLTNNPALQVAALAYTALLHEFRCADFYISMDVDEFINIRLGKGHLSDLLEETGPFDALSISELNHGSNAKEDYERGFVTELFPRHQTEGPGAWRSRRGVKTIVRVGEKIEKIRNHRPDMRKDVGEITWLNGSGKRLDSLHNDDTENGIDIRGTYGLAVLDHFPLRSLNSYLVKMFRGDVVVKDKMVSQRYWRSRDHHLELTSTHERQQEGFQKAYELLLKDEKLAQLHDDCCSAHEARIEALLKDPFFQDRKRWVLENTWGPDK